MRKSDKIKRNEQNKEKMPPSHGWNTKWIDKSKKGQRPVQQATTKMCQEDNVHSLFMRNNIK